MAKQEGIHQLRGKVGQMKYYGMKGVTGGLVQSINQGMGDRVKNGAEYANTRRNNAEFGGAGSTAGVIIRSLSQKWRYLLVPFATGKLASDIKQLMSLDTTGKWGQRGLVGTSWQAMLAEKVANYSKNSVSDFAGLELSASLNASTGMQVSVSADELLNDILAAKGVAGVRVIPIAAAIDASAFNTNSGKYAPATAECVEGTAVDVELGDELTASVTAANIKATAQAANKMFAGIVVLLPYKTINGEKVIMQELCSFTMFAA